jgi:hypothetical protein
LFRRTDGYEPVQTPFVQVCPVPQQIAVGSAPAAFIGPHGELPLGQVQRVGADGVGTVHDSIVSDPPRHDQRVHWPLGHSLLLRQSCVAATAAGGQSPFTSVWQESVPAVVLVDDRQQTLPSVQSAASLQVTIVPEHEAPAVCATSGSPMTSQHCPAGILTGPASPHVIVPGEHVAPPSGGSQLAGVSPAAASMSANPSALEDVALVPLWLVVLAPVAELDTVECAEEVAVVEEAPLVAFDEVALLFADDEAPLEVPTELLLEQCIIVMPAKKAAGQAERIQVRFMGKEPPNGAS